jgi:hypothetical protein
MSEAMTPDSLEILLLMPENYPDTAIDETVIRVLLKKHPERFRELLGGGEPLTGRLEVFYSPGDDTYQVWHEVVTENPGDEYLGVAFTSEEVAEARAKLQDSIIKDDILDKPHLKKGKTKKKTGPLL